MHVVDTNILIFAAFVDAKEHRVCRKLVTTMADGRSPWHLTWGIVYEFLRVATSAPKKPLTFAQAWTFIGALLDCESCTVLAPGLEHARWLDKTVRENGAFCGGIIHDAHTAVLMREHGLRRIYTADTDFHRFDFLEVLNPLTKSRAR